MASDNIDYIYPSFLGSETLLGHPGNEVDLHLLKFKKKNWIQFPIFVAHPVGRF